MVDAVRSKLAAHGAVPHGDDLMAIDDEEKCAAEERRLKRRQKRKERKRAGKAQGLPSASAASTAAAARGGRGGGGKSAATAAAVKPRSPSGATAKSTAVLGRRTINGSAASTKPSAKNPLHDHNTEEPKSTAEGLRESRGGGGGDGGGSGGGRGSTAMVGKGKGDAGADSARACITTGLNSGLAAKVCFACAYSGFESALRFAVEVGVHFCIFVSGSSLRRCIL